MTFHNETLHPEAPDLFALISKGADNYEALALWQHSRGMTDEQTADLYSYIEEAFDAKPINSLTYGAAVSLVSGCLWKSEAVSA